MDTIPIDPRFLAATPLPDLDEAGNKDARGAVLVIGGSRQVPGAVLLAAAASLRVGAGKLQVATVGSLAPHMALVMPEARVIPLAETAEGEIGPNAAEPLMEDAAKTRALLIGPGMMDEDGARRLTLDLVSGTQAASFVLDAAAITGLRDHASFLASCEGRLVITPHSGEMATFLGIHRDAVEADPIGAGRRAASAIGGIVAVKGACTHICDPDGKVWSCEGGGVGMATSGSGDVLAGVIAGLMARGASALQAAQWGVFLHAEAGRRLARRIGPVGYLARELPGELPSILKGDGR